MTFLRSVVCRLSVFNNNSLLISRLNRTTVNIYTAMLWSFFEGLLLITTHFKAVRTCQFK